MAGLTSIAEGSWLQMQSSRVTYGTSRPKSADDLLGNRVMYTLHRLAENNEIFGVGLHHYLCRQTRSLFPVWLPPIARTVDKEGVHKAHSLLLYVLYPLSLRIVSLHHPTTSLLILDITSPLIVLSNPVQSASLVSS